MTTNDTDALTERIARALYENAEYYGPAPTQPPWDWRDDEERGEWIEVAAAVLPIVAVEVRKAKAEALRELSAHISEVVDNAKPWQVFTEHVLHEAGACDYLDRAATEYETGDSDERR